MRVCAGEAGVGAVVAEVERCLAGQAELAARLAGSKAMLEQRDELIRQLNVGVRAATLAKEAALQRAADLEARAAANQRTVATLSAEIAEVRGPPPCLGTNSVLLALDSSSVSFPFLFQHFPFLQYCAPSGSIVIHLDTRLYAGTSFDAFSPLRS